MKLPASRSSASTRPSCRSNANSDRPALNFVDKTGWIRHVHIGEGDYARSDQIIRELLAEPAPAA